VPPFLGSGRVAPPPPGWKLSQDHAIIVAVKWCLNPLGYAADQICKVFRKYEAIAGPKSTETMLN